MKDRKMTRAGAWVVLFTFVLFVSSGLCERTRATLFKITSDNVNYVGPTLVIANSASGSWFFMQSVFGCDYYAKLAFLSPARSAGSDYLLEKNQQNVVKHEQDIASETIAVDPVSNNLSSFSSINSPSWSNGIGTWSVSYANVWHVARTDNCIWFTSNEGEVTGSSVVRFNPMENSFYGWQCNANWQVAGIAASNDEAWVAVNASTGKLLRFEGENTEVIAWELPDSSRLLGVALSSDGQVWVSDPNSHLLYLVDPQLTSSSDVEKFTMPFDDGPSYLLSDGKGGVWMSGLDNGDGVPALGHLSPEGHLEWWPLPGFVSPSMLKMDPFGRVWVIDSRGNRVGFLDVSKSQLVWWDLPDAAQDSYGLDIDLEGNVWFSNTGGYYVGFLDHAAHYTLYLPHFDNTVGWWTGVALNNIADTEATVILEAYGNDGSLLGRYELPEPIPPYGKWACVVSEIFPDSDTGWIKVISDQPIKGFVLFGRETVLAGVPACELPKQVLVFPHFDQSALWWTGVAFVNTSEMSAGVSIGARNDDGNSLSSVSRQLAEKEKVVGTVEELFEIVESTGSIKAQFDYWGAGCGFVLFGTKDGQTLAGVPAGGS